MALQLPAPTAEAVANQAAQRLIMQARQLAQQITQLRTQGIAAIPAREATTGPNGQQIPANPGQPAVSATLMVSVLDTNNAALDAIVAAAGN